MKLSVVIPFYKELDVIQRAVESVIINTELLYDVEVLICNDGPYDEDKIRSRLNQAQNAVTYIIRNQYPSGPGGARNTGLDAANGFLIAFLDADDYWLEGKLNAQLTHIKQGATFVASAYKFDVGQAIITPPSQINNAIEIFLNRGIGTSTVLVTKELVSECRFRNIRFSQDIDFWFVLANRPNFRFRAVHQCHVVYSTEGSTKNKIVQLIYFYNVLKLNKISFINRARVIFSYIIAGIYNHYIRARISSY